MAAAVDGAAPGIAASSFTSVSLEPPLVSFSVATSSSTWPLLREAGHLGLSVLADHHDEVCRQLAGPREQRFDGLPFSVTEDGAVLLDEARGDLRLHRSTTRSRPATTRSCCSPCTRVGAGDGEHPLVFHRSGFAKLHRDDLDPTRLDGRINGAEVGRGTDPTAVAARRGRRDEAAGSARGRRLP